MLGVPLPIETHLLQAMVTEPVKPLLDTVLVYVAPGHAESYISQSDRGGMVLGGHIDVFEELVDALIGQDLDVELIHGRFDGRFAAQSMIKTFFAVGWEFGARGLIGESVGDIFIDIGDGGFLSATGQEEHR
jgi:glycine/D-amino acid oxidase-like deaminating enzyme